MSLRDQFRVLIGTDEGCRLTVYLDTRGVPTIGYGRNLRDKGISPAEAAYLRDNDIADAERDCQTLPWFGGLSDARQLVILSMVYNMGLGTVQTFRRMIAALQRFDYDSAADEMLLSEWAHQVGARAHRLAEMMRHG